MINKEAQVREALLAAKEEIQMLRRRLELAEARVDVLDTLAYITGRRSVNCGSGWPNALKLIEEALMPEPNKAPTARGNNGCTVAGGGFMGDAP